MTTLPTVSSKSSRTINQYEHLFYCAIEPKTILYYLIVSVFSRALASKETAI